MNCDKAATLVARYADGEMGRFRRQSIERHLSGCPACATAHQELLALRGRLRAEAPYFKAPAQLRTRLQAMAADRGAFRPARPRPAPDRWRWLGGGALAGCAATLMLWVVGGAVVEWTVQRDVGNEAVALHTQATLSGPLIEVASSDQHTVKPWLSARLDYSPPVRDLVDEGFALSGGRLDTLQGRRVATLVYRHRQHVIDVFVQPQSTRALSAPRTVRGFNVAYASGSGMDWLAVSDVSPDVLSAFVQRLARGEATR
jgi:anti-sigma factor RsiW